MFTRSTRKVENGPVSTPETDPASVSSRLNCRPPLSSSPSNYRRYPANAFTETPFPSSSASSFSFPFSLALFHLRISSSRIDPFLPLPFPGSRSDSTKDSINPAAELRRNDYPGTEWPLERKHTRRENFNLLLLIGGN